MADSRNNDTVMGPELIKSYQMLLNNKLEQNEKQIKIITDYKNRHKKVIEGLQVYPLSVSENCMVPIGKRAFMKGKLSHTNEILAFLGDGYFAKYSAVQAIALCNRRIAWADEMLKNLEIETNLYEMRQFLPLEHDAFGEKDRKDIIEHWTEDKLDEWRVQHRQREKEYHQRLAELRKKEKTDICTEKDLFKRLNELEMEEELEDEIYRLKAEQKKFYDDNLKDGEIYDESEEDLSDSDQSTTDIIQEELKKLKDIQINKNSNTSNISSDVVEDKIVDINTVKNEEKPHSSADFILDTLIQDRSLESKEELKNTNIKEKRRISFAEPCIIEDTSNVEEKISMSQEAGSSQKQDDASESFENEEDIIRIEFLHSSHSPDIPETNDAEIKSPVDIYKMFNTPKSILKRSPNDMIQSQVIPPLNEYNSTDTEDEDEYVKYSAYSSVIQEKVEENKISPANNVSIKNEKRTVSRFKLERAGRKK